MTLALISHIYMGFVLLKTAIPSATTKFLLYVQCIIEGMYSILVIVQTNTRNFTPVSNKVPVNSVLCHLFQSGALSIFFRITLYSYVSCQSIDRFLALAHPNTYRVHAKYYIMGFTIAVPVYSMLSSIPRIVNVQVIEGSCLINPTAINPYLLTVLESLLRFVIPASILIPMNVMVRRKLQHLQPLTTGNSNTEQCSQNNDNCEIGVTRKSSDYLASLQKSLFINTFFITMEMTFIECAFVVLTILSFCGILRYDAGAAARVFFLCSMIIVDSLNPILSLWTIKALRTTVANHGKFICRVLRKMAPHFWTQNKLEYAGNSFIRQGCACEIFDESVGNGACENSSSPGIRNFDLTKWSRNTREQNKTQCKAEDSVWKLAQWPTKWIRHKQSSWIKCPLLTDSHLSLHRSCYRNARHG